MSEQNRTKPNGRLTPQQERAAVLLARGVRPSEVIDDLGVGRTTLWDWRQLSAFEARFNEELEEAQEALRSKIRSIQLKALDVVEVALDSGEADLRERLAAARIAAKLCPLPEPRPPGATDPEEIAEEKARGEARRQEKERLAKLPAEERRAELRRKHEEEMADLLASVGG